MSQAIVTALTVFNVPKSTVRLCRSVASLSQRVMLTLSAANSAFPVDAVAAATGISVQSGVAAAPIGVPKAYAPVVLLSVILYVPAGILMSIPFCRPVPTGKPPSPPPLNRPVIILTKFYGTAG